MSALAMDAKVAVRSLRRRPAFTAAAVGTLALAIGANTTVFGVLDAVIFRPIAVTAPNELVAVYERSNSTAYGPSSISTYRTLIGNSSLSGLAMFAGTRTLSGTHDGAVEDWRVQLVSDNYFSVLGVVPALGRVFAPATAVGTGENAVVVLSHSLWQTRFGSDLHIVGRRVTIAEHVFSVIGVAPERFQGTAVGTGPDAWMPASMGRLLDGEKAMFRPFDEGSQLKIFTLVGRLAPGVTIGRAMADLKRLGQLETSRPTDATATPSRFTLVPLVEAAAAVNDRDGLVAQLRLISGVVIAILLLACVSLANLSVIRAGERSIELGVRAALGGTAARLSRLLLTESAVLAMLGGALGLVVATVAIRICSAVTLPGGIELGALHLQLNLRILLFTLLASCGSAIGFGLLPALQVVRGNIANGLRRADESRQPKLFGRQALLAVQVAVSFMLVVDAALFLRSIQQGFSTNLGFDPRSVAAVDIWQDVSGSHKERARRYASIVAQAARLPGVQVAAAGTHVPLNDIDGRPFGIGPEPKTVDLTENTTVMPLASVSPNYFDALRIPVVAGRAFGAQDVSDGMRVVILNEAAARVFSPGASPLGKQIHWLNLLTYTVVGVVRDSKYRTLTDRDTPFAYAPMSQEDGRGRMTFIVRGDHPKDALALLQRTIRDVAPTLATRRPRLVTEQISEALRPQQFGATVLSLFGALALCLSAVGIYGTVSYAVARRTREIGIRMALGAKRVDVLGAILTDASIAIAAGLGAGLVGTALSAQLVVHLLYGVGSTDWLACVAAFATMVITAGVATLIPARRAILIDPMKAIRAS